MAESTDLFMYAWDVLEPKARESRGNLSKSHLRLLDITDNLSKGILWSILPDLKDKDAREFALALLVLKSTKEVPSFTDASKMIDYVFELINSIGHLKESILYKYNISLIAQIASTKNEALLDWIPLLDRFYKIEYKEIVLKTF